MTVYYNEFDPYCAQWLRNLIAAGHLSDGVVDERDIREVEPDDVAGFAQAHFFAGIGGWPHAMRLAGWPDDCPLWTGSCPCQPFSAAGKRQGFADERHLWPVWFGLIAQCRPASVAGEQVASKDGLAWLDAVCADLEGAGYAVGAADCCAAGVGAPHIRQRLWWVADHTCGRRAQGCAPAIRLVAEGPRPLDDSVALSLAHNSSTRLEIVGLEHARRECASAERSGAAVVLADRDAPGQRAVGREGLSGDGDSPQRHDADGRGAPIVLGNPPCNGKRKSWIADSSAHQPFSAGRSSVPGFWSDADWIWCRDEKWRPVEPGSFPLAHGVSGRLAVRRPARQGETEIQEEHYYNRIGALRALGNAIVPQVAAEILKAWMECAP